MPIVEIKDGKVFKLSINDFEAKYGIDAEDMLADFLVSFSIMKEIIKEEVEDGYKVLERIYQENADTCFKFLGLTEKMYDLIFERIDELQEKT